MMGTIAYIDHHQIEPLLQGELDGLCGVYACINAIRWLCPEAAGNDVAEDLFRMLVRSIEAASDRPIPILWQGMGGWLLRRLLKVACKYANETLGVQITQDNLEKTSSPSTLPYVWTRLIHALDGNSICILALSGRIDHWTVAVRATTKVINLFDSNELNLLLRSRTTLQRSTRRIQLVPDQMIHLTRV